jgi:hypothetical protein
MPGSDGRNIRFLRVTPISMNKLFWNSAFAAAMIWLATTGMASSQTTATAKFFPFVIPWDDSSAGTATDVSWLNHYPAGAGGYIVARDGHFYESKTGARVRFLGTNFTFESDFPSHEDAEKVAAHLAKLGINIVRIHHHDADYGELWDKRYPDHQHFDPGAIDRLDYLIYQLKLHGIYVDLNLHVSRQFTAADGFPAGVDDIKLDYDKRVDYFDPRMIALQKSFAHDYLSHVNPYTKLSYADDPCVAIIEINNENSLVSNAAEQEAAGLDDLPEPFRGELLSRWNAWLKSKYGDDAHLIRAWTAGAGTLGDSLIAAGSSWRLEQQGQAEAKHVFEAEGELLPLGDGPPAHFHVGSVDGTDWHVQASFAGLDLAEGKTYTVTFKARADQPRSMGVYAGLDVADWHHIGLDTTAQVGTDWQTYTYTFDAEDVVANHDRLVFLLGNQTGDVWLRDVQLRPGVDIDKMIDRSSLASSTIPMPAAATKAERADWVEFLADVERDYAAEMRSYVMHDLGAHANVICTQISWGNAEGLYREQFMDMADNHSYWQHPSFPGKPWDSKDWLVQNTPMTADMAGGGGGTLRSLAEYRVAGKPYTITEYNEPAPSDYRCETVPELAAFAAAQDWDGIFLFDWGSYGTGAANDKVQGYFSTGSDPARAAFLPSAALIFRGYELASNSQSATLTLPIQDSLSGKQIAAFWSAAGAANPDYLGSRLAVRLSTKAPTPSIAAELPSTDAPASFSEHGTDPAGAYFTCGSHAAIGYLGGKHIDLGDNRISVDPFGDNFCAVTIASRDTTEMSASVAGHQVLITIVGKVENNNMGWNANRTSVGDQWGDAPSMAEFVPATISIPAEAKATVYALDGTGKRTGTVASTYDRGRVSFRTDPAVQTIWYEVAW